MDIGEFCGKVFHPRTLALTAIGGGLSGRFCGISPLDGAVYAVVCSVVTRTAFKISGAVFQEFRGRLKDIGRKKGFTKHMIMPILGAPVYLGHLAGTQTLSLLGRQIAFVPAVKVFLASGITGFFTGVLMDCISEKFD